MVKPNPIGHDQGSLNLHSSGEGLCSSALVLVPWNVFITFILLGQSLCLPARLHTLSLSHSPCSGDRSILECLLEQEAISSPGPATEDCSSQRSPSCCYHRIMSSSRLENTLKVTGSSHNQAPSCSV